MQVTVILGVLHFLTVFYFALADFEGTICRDLPDRTYIPHPIECNQYIICENRLAIVKTCPNGTWYNPSHNNCGKIYDYCEEPEENATTITPFETTLTTTSNPITSTQSPIITSTEPSALPTLPTTQPIRTTPIMDIYPKCPPYDTPGPTYIASKVRCDTYYLCYHGQPLQMKCPSGYDWSQYYKRCISVSESTCISEPTFCVPGCPEYGQHFYPHPGNCRYFYYCENGIQSTQQCAFFYHWDIQEKKCKYKTSANCIRSVPEQMRLQYY